MPRNKNSVNLANNDKNLSKRPSKRKYALDIEESNKKIKLDEIVHDMSDKDYELYFTNLLQKNLYQCEECGIACYNKIEHIIEKHEDQLIDCSNCNKSIFAKDYRNHIYQCSKLLGYQCEYCNQVFDKYETGLTHSEICKNSGIFVNDYKTTLENPDNRSCRVNNKNIEVNDDDTQLINQEQYPHENSPVRKCDINENSAYEKNSNQNFRNGTYNPNDDLEMMGLVEDILNDRPDLADPDTEVINNFAKAIEKTDVGKILNIENEELLRGILPKEIETKEQELETEIVTGVSIVNMITSLSNANKPVTIKPNEELIPLARKKRSFIEKEKQTKEMEEIRREIKAKEITFTKLITMDKNKDLEIEEQIDRIMGQIEIETIFDETSDFDESVLLLDENIYLPDEELNEIMKICNERDLEKINSLYESVKLNEYVDPNNLPICSIDEQYNCHICGSFSTDQFSEFYSHLSIHNNEIYRKNNIQKRGQCLICGVLVPQILLNNHIKMHIDHIRCNICKEFVPEDTLECHISAHSKHYSCNTCGEIYKSISAIRKHYVHHRKGTSYSCSECRLRFCSLEKLVRHVSQEHKSIDIDYAECIYCFELTDNIKNHIYSTGLCKLKCKCCLKVSKTNEEFLKHRLEHTSDKSSIVPRGVQNKSLYKCNLCGLISDNFNTASAHNRCHKIDAMYEKSVVHKPRAVCNICQSVVPKNYLQNHINKHQFYDKCGICKQFVLKSDLLHHTEKHKTQFQCKTCEQVFPNKKTLEDHNWAHYRLCQRPCGECQLEFNSEITRVKHMSLIHGNIDSEFVECYYCKELLMVEIEYHILDVRYCQRRCKLCNQRFKSAPDYEWHVISKHKEFLEHNQYE